MSFASEFPESDGDFGLKKIVNDPCPRSAHSALGDDIAKRLKTMPLAGPNGQHLRRPSMYHLLEVLAKEKELTRIEWALERRMRN